jgi:hypothetical protein
MAMIITRKHNLSTGQGIKMPYKVSYNEKLKTVDVLFDGVVTQEELFDMLREVTSMAYHHSTSRFFSDCTTMEGGHSIFDLFFLINAYETAEIPKPMREAILIPLLPAAQKEVEFYETACQNRGYNVKLFDNREAAIKWIVE